MIPSDKPGDGSITQYPWAVRVLAAASHTDLGLEVIQDETLAKLCLARVRVRVEGSSHDVVVDNEYRDADAGHRPLLLAMVLMTIDLWDDCDDALEWSREMGLPVGDRHTLDLFHELGHAVQAFQHRFKELSGPPGLEWELNSGGVQALRRIAAGENE